MQSSVDGSNLSLYDETRIDALAGYHRFVVPVVTATPQISFTRAAKFPDSSQYKVRPESFLPRKTVVSRIESITRIVLHTGAFLRIDTAEPHLFRIWKWTSAETGSSRYATRQLLPSTRSTETNSPSPVNGTSWRFSRAAT